MKRLIWVNVILVLILACAADAPKLPGLPKDTRSYSEKRRDFEWCKDNLSPASFHYPEFGHNWWEHVETEREKQRVTNFRKMAETLKRLCADGTNEVGRAALEVYGEFWVDER